MATLNELKIILDDVKKDTDTIMAGVYGNGTKGLKSRVVEIEVKFWIIIILLVPLSAYVIRNIIVG